jgi:hypothetical protein
MPGRYGRNMRNKFLEPEKLLAYGSQEVQNTCNQQARNIHNQCLAWALLQQNLMSQS